MRQRLIEKFIAAYLERDVRAVRSIHERLSGDDAVRPFSSAILAALVVRDNPGADYAPLTRTIIGLMSRKPPAKDMFVAALYEGASMAMLAWATDDARMIMSFLSRLDMTGVHPGIRTLVVNRRATMDVGRHAPGRIAENLERGLAPGVKAGTYPWIALKLNHVDMLIENADYARAAEVVGELETYRKNAERYRLPPPFIMRAKLLLETGDNAGAVRIFSALSADEIERQRVRIVPIFGMALVKNGERERAGDLIERIGREDVGPARAARRRNVGMLLCAMRALSERKLAEARRDIYEFYRSIDRDERIFSMTMAVLASVELASGNADGAERVLRTVDPEGTLPANRMAWARLAALRGDEAPLVNHLRELRRGAYPLLAEDRLRFAYELSAGDVARIFRLADERGIAVPRKPPAGRHDDKIAPVFVGVSAHAQNVRELVRRYANLDRTVLITGDTGTGKEVVARMLHAESDRRNEPFVAVNCGSLGDTLFYSELFGHVKGAFTGATGNHPGLFLSAGGGTICLDEVENMSAELQAALLRVLETGAVRPVGRTREIGFSARIVAASNQNLKRLAQEGRFRQDLYYRLARAEINLVPLSERPEDIAPLVGHFLERHGQASFPLAPRTMSLLTARAWPGNARELENHVAKMLLFSDDGELPPDDDKSDGEAVSDAPLQTNMPRSHTGAFFRRERLKEIFRKRKKLTRIEVQRLVGCSPVTAGSDLRALEAEGFVERVVTSANLRTSYYRLRGFSVT